jgi:hypothetical protein
MYKIGQIIDSRPDGSYIYMSHKGILNLDDWKDLESAKSDDKSFSLTSPSTEIRDSAHSLKRALHIWANVVKDSPSDKSPF